MGFLEIWEGYWADTGSEASKSFIAVTSWSSLREMNALTPVTEGLPLFHFLTFPKKSIRSRLKLISELSS